MANIAEGFDRRTHKEFKSFLLIALASNTEVKSHLYVALDQQYINQADFDSTYDRCTKTAKLIIGFVKYLSSA